MKTDKFWDKLRLATKNKWDGKINEWVEYDAPDVHLFGEHIFDAGGEDYGDYYYKGQDVPENIKRQALKVISRFINK